VEILLIHPGGLGDIILSLPAIALLRERFPAARVTIAGNIDHLAPVAEGYAETVTSLSMLPLHNLYLDSELLQPEVQFWKSFDRILSWSGAGDTVFTRNLKKIHPTASVESWKPGPKEPRHVSQLFVDSLGSEIAAGRLAYPAPIRLGPEATANGLEWLSERGWRSQDSLVAIHPGAGSKAKRWPVTRFAIVARHLVLQEKKKLLIVEGPAESGISAQISGELPSVQVLPSESIPLNVLASVIAHAGLFIGNDSGIAHLAAALKVPSIVLFGPTLPQHWAPLGPEVIVLKDTRDCLACSAGGDDHTCLENITVEKVIRSAINRR